MSNIDSGTRILNVGDRDDNWVKILFDPYIPATTPTGYTKGLLSSLQEFYNLYALNPANIREGFDFAGTIGNIYQVKVSENDIQKYLGDAFSVSNGLTLTINGTSNEVIDFALDIQETSVINGYSLLSNGSTLKQIKAGTGTQIIETATSLEIIASSEIPTVQLPPTAGNNRKLAGLKINYADIAAKIPNLNDEYEYVANIELYNSGSSINDVINVNLSIEFRHTGDGTTPVINVDRIYARFSGFLQYTSIRQYYTNVQITDGGVIENIELISDVDATGSPYNFNLSEDSTFEYNFYTGLTSGSKAWAKLIFESDKGIVNFDTELLPNENVLDFDEQSYYRMINTEYNQTRARRENNLGHSVASELLLSQDGDKPESVLPKSQIEAMIGGGGSLYNPSTTPIPSGTPLHLTHTQVVLGTEYPVFQYAKADIHEHAQGSLVFADGDIAGTSIGNFTYESPNLECDLSYLDINISRQLWLSTTEAGKYTNVRPPDKFAISMGGMFLDQSRMWANITTTTYNRINDIVIGSILETFECKVRSTDGINVVATLTNGDNILDNLTLVLPDLVTFDTTTSPATINLTAGTNDNTQTNYIFIPEDTKQLTVSTTGWPTNQNHCRIADPEVQSAANVQSVGGARANQNWNDHFKKENGNGHLLHMTDWIRRQFAKASTAGGCAVTLNSAGGNGYISVTAGEISQLHKQSISAMTMPTLDCLIANDPDTTNRATDNLDTITKFSDGSNWSGKWGKIVVWISANKGGEPNFIYVNLPRGGENDEAKALKDEKSRANYGIPDELTSKAALIGAFAIKIQGGDIIYNGASTGFQELRGTIPSNTAGGGSGGVSSLLALDDVSPSSFVGQAGKSLTVASSETTTEFVEFLKIDGSNASQDIDIGTYSIKGNDAIFDSMRLTNPNTPLSLGVTYVRQPRMFNLRSDAGAIIEFERDTEDFGCRQVLGANFYDFYTGATGSMSQRLRLGLTASYFYNDLYIVGKLTNVSSIVSTGTIKANTNELVLTENIVDDLKMNGFDIKDAENGTFTGNISLDSSSGRLVARNTANDALVVYGHNPGSIGENNYGFYSTIMAKNILQLNATNGDIEVARSGSFGGEVSRQGFFEGEIGQQAITSGLLFAITGHSRIDTDFYEHSTSTNNSTVKIKVAGWYKVNVEIGMSFIADGVADFGTYMYLEKSTTSATAGFTSTSLVGQVNKEWSGNSGSSAYFQYGRSKTMYFAANTWVRNWVGTSSNGTVTSPTTVGQYSSFSLEKVT